MRTRAIAVAILLFGFGSFLMLPNLAVGTVSVVPPVAAQPRQEPSCPKDALSEPHYYFFDSKKESAGAFGPSADLATDRQVKRELIHRLCGDAKVGGDPLLRHVIARLHWNGPVPLPFAFLAEDAPPADRLVDGIDWKRSHVVERTLPEGTYTLSMSDGKSAPTLDYVELGRRHSRYLALYFEANRSEKPVLLRLPCGFQPVFEEEEPARQFVTNP